MLEQMIRGGLLGQFEAFKTKADDTSDADAFWDVNNSFSGDPAIISMSWATMTPASQTNVIQIELHSLAHSRSTSIKS